MDKQINYLKKYYKGNIEDAIKRLENGEPVQYIVGNINFYGYQLIINKNVLIPRRETEELVEEVIKRSKNFNNPVISDIGTGSGAIAIALSKELNSNVVASDISDDALEIAHQNIKLNNAAVTLLKGDMLQPFIDNNIKLDIIVSNPPYISYNDKIEKIVYDNEPHIALFANNDGLQYYESILSNANKVLKDKYLIAFEIGMDQQKSIIKLVNKYLKEAKTEVKKDLSFKDRMLFVYNY